MLSNLSLHDASMKVLKYSLINCDGIDIKLDGCGDSHCSLKGQFDDGHAVPMQGLKLRCGGGSVDRALAVKAFHPAVA